MTKSRKNYLIKAATAAKETTDKVPADEAQGLAAARASADEGLAAAGDAPAEEEDQQQKMKKINLKKMEGN